MNTQMLQQYDIKFLNVNGTKQVSFRGNELIERYINIFNNVEVVEIFLLDVDLCISGQVEATSEYLYGSNPPIANYGDDDGGCIIWARMDSANITLEEDEIINDSITIPLADWKEILLSWKEFLES